MLWMACKMKYWQNRREIKFYSIVFKLMLTSFQTIVNGNIFMDVNKAGVARQANKNHYFRLECAYTYRHIYSCVYFHKWDNTMSVLRVVFLLFHLYKWLLKQLWKSIGDKGRSKGVYDPREVNKLCGHMLCGQFELAHRWHRISLSHRGCYFVLYPLALMFHNLALKWL